MVIRTFLILTLIVTVMVAPTHVMAQQAAPEKDAKPSAAELAEAQSKALNDRMTEIMHGLDQEEANHFIVMYTNYNAVSLVKAVQKDIAVAVKTCADNNPSLKDDVNDRFTKWKKSVGEVMVEAEANIKNLSLAQTYLPQSEIKTLFGMVDSTREYNSSRFETVPVSTPEACEFMMSKMDETEEGMKQLMQVALISFPNILRKNQQ